MSGFRFIDAEDVWEGVSERGCALDGSEMDFAYAGTGIVSKVHVVWGHDLLPIIEAEDGSCNVQCNVLGDSGDVLVKCSSHVIIIAEDECLLGVESNGNDIFRITTGITLNFLNCTFFGEDVFLIICKHDDQWNIEYIL